MVLDRLLMTRAGFNEGAQFDLLRGDEGATENNLLQIMNPVNYAPELRDTLFRANALAIAQQLLGEQATPFFEHAIFKPAGRGAATPWHQDEAYRPEPDYVYRELSIWMPLQDVSVENGCMQFVPGTNRGDVLIHRSANNDPNTHALECCGNFDRTKAVACPLPSGGCTVHDGRTLHYAGRTGPIFHVGHISSHSTCHLSGAPGRASLGGMMKSTARTWLEDVCGLSLG